LIKSIKDNFPRPQINLLKNQSKEGVSMEYDDESFYFLNIFRDVHI